MVFGGYFVGFLISIWMIVTYIHQMKEEKEFEEELRRNPGQYYRAGYDWEKVPTREEIEAAKELVRKEYGGESPCDHEIVKADKVEKSNNINKSYNCVSKWRLS